MFKRLPAAGTTPNRASKDHLHQWLVDVSPAAVPTTVRAARRTWLPAFGLALIVSTTMLACGSDETQEQPSADQSATTQEATKPASTSTPTKSSGTQPAQDDNDGRSTPAARETRERESATDMPEPTAAPTDTSEPTLTPTPTPVPHHEFPKFMAPFNEQGKLVHRMPDDGSENPIYPINRIWLGGDGDENYPQYRHLRHHAEGVLQYPGFTKDLFSSAITAIKRASSEEIRRQMTPEDEAAGVPTLPNYLEFFIGDQARKRAEWQLVSSTPEEMVITIMTYFIHPRRYSSTWDKSPSSTSG